MANDKNGTSTLYRNDLFLLMEAYRNNFESSTTLLEQQKHLMDQFQQIISEQKATRKSMDDVVTNLDKCSRAMSDFTNTWRLGTTELRQNFQTELNVIKNKVHIVWIGIGALVIPLIGLTVKVVSNLDALHTISHAVSQLSGAG